MKSLFKRILFGLAALVFILPPAMAKVTLEDVYKADEAQRAQDLAEFEQYKRDYSYPLEPSIWVWFSLSGSGIFYWRGNNVRDHQNTQTNEWVGMCFE
ncbi:hypothetical protein AB4562_09480 [Vibrio sp. 10N.222.54.A1]|uniref:hypothetical protein n=1 Tax=Vibrio sp. 10N.222.54.A1 TaxID=3229632 RepID=UPI00354BDDC0